MKTDMEKIDWENFDYSKFREFVLEESFSYQMSKPLYHYTNLEALINILKTKTLWAINSEYTNDLLELKDIKRMMEDFSKDEDRVIKELVNIYNDHLLENMQKAQGQTYIISFTTNNDSVAMWRNYGKSGVVLEFDTSLIMKKINEEETKLFDKDNKQKTIFCTKRCGTVIYDDNEIKRMVKKAYEIYKASRELNDKKKEKDLQGNIIYLLLDVLYVLNYTKKDPNFSYENEIRAMIILDEKDTGTVENFRIKNNLIIPYIAVDFTENDYLPLKSITINPENKDYMYESGIRHLLKTYNYDIPMKFSKSRIR